MNSSSSSVQPSQYEERNTDPNKYKKIIDLCIKLYNQISSVKPIPDEKSAKYITRSEHLKNMTTHGLNNFDFESWKQTFIPVCQYALKHKLYIVSVGCGVAYLESLLIKIVQTMSEDMKISNINDPLMQKGIVCVDPTPQSFNSGDPNMEISYPTVDDLLAVNTHVKNNCVLILNWATPSMSYDFDAIHALSPQIVLSCFDTWGCAGSSRFHQWMNLSGLVHTDLCFEYSDTPEIIRARYLSDFTSSLSVEELKWVSANKYKVLSLYHSCFRIKDKYDVEEYIKIIKEPTLTIVAKHDIDLDLSDVPQNVGQPIENFGLTFSDLL